eukprot:gene1706-1974_t
MRRGQPRVDYGLVRQAERGDPQIALGKRTLRLSMACEVPVSMALRFTGVPAGLEGFRFGRQGHFTLSLQSAQVDGKSVELVMPHLSEEPATGRLLPGHRLVAHVAGMPVHGRRFTALVNVETFLPAALLAVRDETTFEGQGVGQLGGLRIGKQDFRVAHFMVRRSARAASRYSPSTSITPSLIDSRPLRVRSRVDLPEPLRPMIATTWPSSTLRSMPLSTW